jgi:hypothetical protein
VVTPVVVIPAVTTAADITTNECSGTGAEALFFVWAYAALKRRSSTTVKS